MQPFGYERPTPHLILTDNIHSDTQAEPRKLTDIVFGKLFWATCAKMVTLHKVTIFVPSCNSTLWNTGSARNLTLTLTFLKQCEYLSRCEMRNDNPIQNDSNVYLVPRRQPIISCLRILHQLVVVVVWDRVRQFVSPSRRFVCDSHTNSRAILNISATNQQQTNVFINNRPTLRSRALQDDSNAAKIIANGLVVTATFRLL
jgi:hypothetical protein